jgi:hypothetical protein
MVALIGELPCSNRDIRFAWVVRPVHTQRHIACA